MSQDSRLMRKLRAQVYPIGHIPQPWGPREEQDSKRERLAEELLKIGLEENCIENFTDTHRREKVEGKDYDTERASLTLLEWYVKRAEAALAAAELVYPELPEVDNVG